MNSSVRFSFLIACFVLVVVATPAAWREVSAAWRDAGEIPSPSSPSSTGWVALDSEFASRMTEARGSGRGLVQGGQEEEADRHGSSAASRVGAVQGDLSFEPAEAGDATAQVASASPVPVDSGPDVGPAPEAAP